MPEKARTGKTADPSVRCKAETVSEDPDSTFLKKCLRSGRNRATI